MYRIYSNKRPGAPGRRHFQKGGRLLKGHQMHPTPGVDIFKKGGDYWRKLEKFLTLKKVCKRSYRGVQP